MHSKRSPLNGYILLKEKNTITKYQNIAAETVNKDFTSAVDSLYIQPFTSFGSQPHVWNIPKHWNHQFIFSLNHMSWLNLLDPTLN